jgi:hypothetical protein
MSRRIRLRVFLSAVTAGLVLVALLALPAGAAKNQSVNCKGTADFCGATISIGGGASNKTVTIHLSDTDFRRIATRVIPGTSKGAFSITKAHFLLGGSEYRFTLNAVKSNPKGARMILLFAAGAKA